MEPYMLRRLHEEEIGILDWITNICNENNIEYFLVGGTLLGAVRHKGFIPWDDDLDIGMPRNDYNRFISIVKNIDDDKYFLDYYRRNKKYWLPFIKIRKKNTIYQEEPLKEYKGNLGIWVDIFPLDNGTSSIEKLEKQQIKIRLINSCLQIKNIKTVKGANRIWKKLVITFSKLIPNSLLHYLVNKKMTFNNKENSEYFVNFGSQYGVKKQTHLKSKYIPFKNVEFEGKLYKAPNDPDYILKKIYGEDYMQLPPIERRITHNPIKIKF